MSNNHEADKKVDNIGDAESGHYSESFDRNRTSSKTKPEEAAANRAGPFGDSPPDSTSNNNYYLFMMGEPDEQEPLDEEDQLMREYMSRINAIQERLQLVHLIELDDSMHRNYENGRVSARGCKITELGSDDDTGVSTNKSSRNASGAIPKSHRYLPKLSGIGKELSEYIASKESFCSITSSSNSISDSRYSSANSRQYKPSFEFSKKYDVATSDNFEVDYNPPKKKHCFRDNSPKIHSISSESYMRYPFFKKNTDSARVETRKLLKKDFGESCSLHDNCKDSKDEEETTVETSTKNSKEMHIFPNVIVKSAEGSQNGNATNTISVEGQLLEINDSSRGSSTGSEYICYTKSEDISPEHSPMSDKTLRSYSTTINSPTKRSKTPTAKSSAKNKINTTEQMSLWDEIQKINPPSEQDDGDFDLISERSKILRREDGSKETKNSIKERVVSLYFNKNTKKPSSSTDQANDMNDSIVADDVNNTKPQSQVKERIAMEEIDHARVPSTLLESFRKSQQTGYHCYSASSHSTKSDINCAEGDAHDKLWNVCSCFCNPFIRR